MLDRFLVLRSVLDFAAECVDWGAGYCATEAAPYALFGSAVLLLHGLRTEIGDIDVFVDHRVWEKLSGGINWHARCPDPDHPVFLEWNHCNGLKVHAFYAWRNDEPEVDAFAARSTAELIGGWWCTPLELIRLHKQMSTRRHGSGGRWTKHVDDVAAIDGRLGVAGLAAAARTLP
jgi:hypothetical protein